MSAVRRSYQVLYGEQDKPREEHVVSIENLVEDPAWIQEMHVRRANFDIIWEAKRCPTDQWCQDRVNFRYSMRPTPADEDFHLRMSQREDYVRFQPMVKDDDTNIHYRLRDYFRYFAPESEIRNYWYAERVGPTQLSYYESVENAKKDKRTIKGIDTFFRTKIGMPERYVELAMDFLGIQLPQPILKFATTREEIKRVYVTGPRSCMSGGNEDEVHQAEAYACDPVAVAYLERDDGEVVARTVVNTKTKEYVRIYGSIDKMRHLLEKQEYTHNQEHALSGCQLLNIKVDNTEIGLPYLDGNNNVRRTECGGFYDVLKRNSLW